MREVPNVAGNPFHYLGQYQYGVDMLLATGHETNHYAYANNDPSNHSDLAGVSALNGCAAAIVGVSLLGLSLISGAGSLDIGSKACK